MIRRIIPGAVASSPLAALATHWWYTVIVVSLGLIAYMCRQWLMYRLASKALDKAPPAQAAAIIAAITGQAPATKTRAKASPSRRFIP